MLVMDVVELVVLEDAVEERLPLPLLEAEPEGAADPEDDGALVARSSNAKEERWNVWMRSVMEGQRDKAHSSCEGMQLTTSTSTR